MTSENPALAVLDQMFVMCGAHDLPPNRPLRRMSARKVCQQRCQNESREQSGLSGFKHHFSKYRHQTIDLVPCHPAPLPALCDGCEPGPR